MLRIEDGIVEKNGILSVSDNGEEFYVNLGKEAVMESLILTK